MNAEPKKTDPAPQHLSFRQALKQAPARFWRMCRHNWTWKLLSVFLAVCLWAGLITQDPTLTRERTFSDVPVSVTGSDTLISNGLVVLSGLEDEALSIRLRADVPQRAYSTASASNYNPRIDLSRITETGEQTLRIQTTSTTTYGTVDSISPDTVTVVVDEYVTNYRVPVSLNLIGSYPTGYYGITPLIDPSSVSVSGPKSIVDQITNVYVDFDLSKLAAQEGLVRTALPMRFADASGNHISSDRLSVTSASVVLRTITVEQRLYPTKTLSVAGLALTNGSPASGYELKSITASPSTLLAAGERSSLDALDSLFVDSPIDLTGKSESFVVDVNLRKPSSLYYLSDNVVTLYVELAPILTTQSFDGLKLEVRGTADGLAAQVAESKVSAALTGPQNVLKALRASQLHAYVDVSGLAAGQYDQPVLAEIDSDSKGDISYAITPFTVSVTLSEK